MRALASLCLIKITLLCLLFLDLPLTGPDVSLQPSGTSQVEGSSASATLPAAGYAAREAALNDVTSAEPALPQNTGVTVQENAQSAPISAVPQGNEAARLAALATPRNPQNLDGRLSRLPVALLPALDRGHAPRRAGTVQNPAGLSLPMPSGRSIQANGAQAADDGGGERSFLDLISLKTLPIPSFGGLQAAHAASLDMPVPTTPAPISPFTPAEQVAPLSGGERVIPGAPPLPRDLISQGQTTIGAQTPFGANYGEGLQQQASGSSAYMPAPHVNPLASRDNADLKAGEIARQQQDILMLRQQMDQRLKDLQSAEKKMKEMIQEAKALEDQKVRNLVQMYANMKPRTAAQALESMDERVAVRILAGMAPKQSGEILTYTDPAKTAKFTELLTRMRMAQ